MVNDELRATGEVPDLRDPVLLAGFAGWSDAGQIATYSLQTLVSAWSARRFAEIEPENFFDFTETRPVVSLGPTGQRKLEWPANTFYAHRLSEHDRDIVMLVGSEPQLRWKSFCRYILTIADRLDVSCLITLGGLLADVPHTREPQLSGFASTPRLLPQLQNLGVALSSYEGPTGIIGALHEAWSSRERPAISLWGSVPHYISATPNPQVALALLRRVSTLLGASLPLSRLENHSQAFARQVDEALQENPDALEYVRELEQEQTDGHEHVAEPPPVDAPALFDALEEFLRTKRPPEESGGM